MNPYRRRGTTSTAWVDSTLLAELPQKTTYPPLALPLCMSISGPLALSAQVPRYTSGTAPDLGYHYPALDYSVSLMRVLSGGDVTVLPGTAIGLRFDYFVGFDLWHKAPGSRLDIWTNRAIALARTLHGRTPRAV